MDAPNEGSRSSGPLLSDRNIALLAAVAAVLALFPILQSFFERGELVVDVIGPGLRFHVTDTPRFSAVLSNVGSKPVEPAAITLNDHNGLKVELMADDKTAVEPGRGRREFMRSAELRSSALVIDIPEEGDRILPGAHFNLMQLDAGVFAKLHPDDVERTDAISDFNHHFSLVDIDVAYDRSWYWPCHHAYWPRHREGAARFYAVGALYVLLAIGLATIAIKAFRQRPSP